MASHDAYDRVRAHVLGLLDAQAAAELERELERDPELRRFADAWREVHALTRPARDEAPASRLTYAELAAAIDRDERRFEAERKPTWIRRAAAAAGILFVAGGAAWFALDRAFLADRASDEPVRLVAIDLSLAGSAPHEKARALPDVLASYHPTAEGEIRWIPSLEEGLEVAAFADRPVLLFGMFPTCPWCLHMKENGLRDAGVLALLEDYVPVQIDYSRLDEAAMMDVFEKGYPRFEIYAPGGELLASFPGLHEAPDFHQRLSDGLTRLPRREPPGWDDVRRLSAELELGRAALGERRYGEAQRILANVSRAGVSGELPRAAGAELLAIGAAASDALATALSKAPDAARLELESSAERFAGTPYERDFAAVLERVRADDALPAIAAN